LQPIDNNNNDGAVDYREIQCQSASLPTLFQLLFRQERFVDKFLVSHNLASLVKWLQGYFMDFIDSSFLDEIQIFD